VALARLLIDRQDTAEALTLLVRIPETPATRALAAEARLLDSGVDVAGRDDAAIEARLEELLELVRDDEAARQEYIDVLETLGPDDARTNTFRRALATRLF
jgi:putative thioredoxin